MYPEGHTLLKGCDLLMNLHVEKLQVPLVLYQEC